MDNGYTPATVMIIEPSQNAIDQSTGLNLKIPQRMIHTGLTKREAFAMAAMQGLLANSEPNSWSEEQWYKAFSSQAVNHADALLKELAK